jgi:AcrR family transcriptional regulator
MRRGLTTEVVVRTGAEMADETGLESVTAAAVARMLEVRTPSLYSHVASTGDLQARICTLALDELADRAAEALAGRSGKDALHALADTYRDYAHHHPGRYAATRLRLTPEAAQASAGPRHVALMQAVLRDYQLDEANQTHAIRLLGSVIHGFVTLELGGSFQHSEPPSEASWHELLIALDATLRLWRRS